METHEPMIESMFTTIFAESMTTLNDEILLTDNDDQEEEDWMAVVKHVLQYPGPGSNNWTIIRW